jgi:peptide/nickel transport system substrate-binding protein
MTVNVWMRRACGIILIAMLSVMLAACGGDDPKPTPTSAPTTAPVSAPTTAASPTATKTATAASPIAFPAASPVSASPVAGTGSSSMTREQFQQQLLAAFPMQPAANKGGTIVLGESTDISTVNPILLFDTTTLNVVGTMFETLVGISPVDGQPVPALADSWEVAPDGLTYTFHLNQEATWHDGVDFTADDVKFSFDAVLDPNTGSLYTTSVNEAVASYRVIDADTFEITARDRFVSFLFNGPGGVFIVPKHVWETVDVSAWSFDGGSTGQDSARVVGTGPFKFKEWVQGERVTVVRNDNYYDVIPNIETLTLAVQPDAEAAVLALQGGQTDIMEIIPPAQTQSVADTPGRAVQIYNFYQITLYGMNLDPQHTQLFQSKDVRQALFYALDRNSITQNIFFGYGEPAIGTQPKLSAAYAPDRMTPNYTYDPAKATALLTQAGWTDSDGNGTVDKDGQEFEFTLLYSGGDATIDQLVAYLQEAWAQVGVKRKLESVDGNAFGDRLRAHDFDMYLSAYGLNPDGDQSILFSCDAFRNGFNFGNYCNPQWDELNERQKREFDPSKRVELLIQQSQIIWDEQAVGPIRFGIARTGYNTRIHNFYPTGYGLLWSLPYIWVDA